MNSGRDQAAPPSPINEKNPFSKRNFFASVADFAFVTAAEVAREIGARDSTVGAWLLGQARPAEPKRIIAFLDSLPRENGSGSLRPAMSTANTKIGAGSQSRAVARFVSRRRATFEEAVAVFQECVRIARRPDRNGRATMRH